MDVDRGHFWGIKGYLSLSSKLVLWASVNSLAWKLLFVLCLDPKKPCQYTWDESQLVLIVINLGPLVRHLGCEVFWGVTIKERRSNPKLLGHPTTYEPTIPKQTTLVTWVCHNKDTTFSFSSDPFFLQCFFWFLPNSALWWLWCPLLWPWPD